RKRELLETRCDVYLGSISLQLGGEGVQPLRITRAKHNAFGERRQAASTARTHISGCSNDQERGSADLPPLHCAHFPDALDNECNSEGITGREDRVGRPWKLIKVTLDQNGAESTQAHDPRSRFDCTGGRGPNSADVVVDVFAIEVIRGNEAVNVQSTRFGAG